MSTVAVAVKPPDPVIITVGAGAVPRLYPPPALVIVNPVRE